MSKTEIKRTKRIPQVGETVVLTCSGGYHFAKKEDRVTVDMVLDITGTILAQHPAYPYAMSYFRDEYRFLRRDEKEATPNA